MASILGCEISVWDEIADSAMGRSRTLLLVLGFASQCASLTLSSNGAPRAARAASNGARTVHPPQMLDFLKQFMPESRPTDADVTTTVYVCVPL